MSPKQILSLRLALNLTQDALAAELGFDGKHRRTMIYRYEKGLSTPSAPVMKMLERMASTPAEVVTLGAALMIVCLGVIAIGLKLGKPDVQV
jgi:transcriptional regulator with XRE-family HTH domain